MADSMVENHPNRVAYFSMEIGLEAGMPTYAGGLGTLSYLIAALIFIAGFVALGIAGMNNGWWSRALRSSHPFTPIFPCHSAAGR